MDIAALKSMPLELRKGSRFVCWRMQEVAGIWVRVPVNAHNGESAKNDDPTTWAALDDAITHWTANQNSLLGVARMLGSDSPPMMAVVFTDCFDEQKRIRRDHPAAKWMDRFDSYSESSSDGTSTTLWIYADHPLGGKTERVQPLGDGRAVSIYRSHQFVPLTGQRLTRYGDVVVHCQPEVNALYLATFGADPQSTKPSPVIRRQPIPNAPPPPSPRPSLPRVFTSEMKIDIAMDFLQAKLRYGGIECARVIAAAEDQGITLITLRRAKRALRVTSVRKSFQGKVLWTIHPY